MSQRITYDVGPLDVTPGQNRISYRPITGADRPPVDGWIVRMKPDLVWANGPRKGKAPQTDKVMFHHGVWVNLSRPDSLFAATGEEKTIMEFPPGFGYRYKASDVWALNHMIHNLTAQPMKLDIQYTVDFIPDSSPAAAGIEPVRPIWMDVQNGSGYPVFDVYKGSGENGKFTYPRDDPNAYPPGVHKNLRTLNSDGVLISTAGHVHTGGLYTDLFLHRPGASYAGPKCNSKPKAAQRRACWEKAPRVNGDRVHLFRSARQVLRAGGAGLMGRGDEGHPPGLEGPGAQGRHARDPGHLRDQAGLLVRVDGDHGRLHGRRHRAAAIHTRPRSTTPARSPTDTCPRTRSTAARRPTCPTPASCRPERAAATPS